MTKSAVMNLKMDNDHSTRRVCSRQEDFSYFSKFGLVPCIPSLFDFNVIVSVGEEFIFTQIRKIEGKKNKFEKNRSKEAHATWYNGEFKSIRNP